jgi:5-methylcytosine-specific restriction endonuclease McrA
MTKQTTYSEKLSDPRWQKRRLDIFNRDNWKCKHCGEVKIQLEIHHTDYWSDRQPWEYTDDMLITLCHNCHAQEQQRVVHERKLIASLKQNGFVACDLIVLSTMLFTHKTFTEYIKIKIREYAQS